VVTKDAYVLYYIRKDFFPDGKIDFDQIRIGLENDTNTVMYQKSIQPPIPVIDQTMVSIIHLKYNIRNPNLKYLNKLTLPQVDPQPPTLGNPMVEIRSIMILSTMS
jgi:hypothetical protein